MLPGYNSDWNDESIKEDIFELYKMLKCQKKFMELEYRGHGYADEFKSGAYCWLAQVMKENEEEIKMNKETIKLRKVWDILLAILILIGITLLMLNAFAGNRYYFELQECKALTYLFIEILFARILYRTLASKKKFTKYMFVITGGILLTVGIFFFNNALHFWGYASMFDYPADLFYKMFLAADLHYTLGLGIIRYILFFVVSLKSFVLIEEGVVRKVCQLIMKVFDTVLELIGRILEKLGILKLFGLEYDETSDEEE